MPHMEGKVSYMFDYFAMFMQIDTSQIDEHAYIIFYRQDQQH